jgi:hypothetical protein
MKMRTVSLLVVLFFVTAVGAASPVVENVDWQAFLTDQDLIWDELPASWDQGPFLGNGEQGTLMYKLDARTVRWDVGCSAAHDHRPVDDDDLSEKNVEVLNRGRHFIGHLRVVLPADLTGGTSHLSLWDAEATGTFTSAGGSAGWTAMVHATEPVMRFELMAAGTLASAYFEYMPEEARSPREVLKNDPRSPVNPSPVLAQLPDGVQTAVHNLYAGGQTAVAWLQTDVAGTKRLWLSVKHSFPASEAEAEAVAAVRAAAAADQTAWVQTHRNWWHNYYPSSFVSTGDAYWDAFYWIQQYKLACATRQNGWIIDNQGPWLQPTPWNATWWNLNVQLANSVGYTANRRENGSALTYRLDINRDNLARNVAPAYRGDSYAMGRTSSGWDLLAHAGQPGGRSPMPSDIGSECGNLLWTLHNIDLEYRYWQDASLRDDLLYPLLKRAVNYYRYFLTDEPDGLLHLPSTHSPEYSNAADCSYDLSLLRWGVGRLLELASEKGLTVSTESLITEWIDIQNRLVPLYVDSSGIMIGKDIALTSSHRHWSHLLSIYPLRTLTPEATADRDLIELSLNHWHSFTSALQGYSFTGGACIAAMLGDGNRAYNLLSGLKDYIRANTMYRETGPVMETPLHGATAIQEMLLQSWGGRLHVFPAVPAAWPDIQFHQLRGEGAFLVSARREQGQTKWVFINAEAGGAVEVQPQLDNAQWITSSGVSVSSVSQGIYSINTSPGDWVLFWPVGQTQPETSVTPIARRDAEYHFGLWTWTGDGDIYEAEDATVVGPVIKSNNLGYTGTGYADYQNASGDYVEWTVTMASGGDFDIAFRYALSDADGRPLEIQVNDQVIDASLSFPDTGGWSTWGMTAPLSVTLNAGDNTVRATAIGASGGNLDHLLIDGNNAPSFTSDPINEIDATEGAVYSSTIADDADDPEGGPMTFSKESGPAWLIVDPNGTLSGTPGDSDTNDVPNVFTVQVSATGGSATATGPGRPGRRMADIRLRDLQRCGPG